MRTLSKPEKGSPSIKPRRSRSLRTITLAITRDNEGGSPGLAELYLKGMGTKQDPVQAALIMWRYRYNRSILSPSWINDLISPEQDDSATLAQVKAVEAGLNNVMTTALWQEAASEEEAQFPGIERHIFIRKLQLGVLGLALAMFTLVPAVCALLLRMLTSRRPPTAGF